MREFCYKINQKNRNKCYELWTYDVRKRHLIFFPKRGKCYWRDRSRKLDFKPQVVWWYSKYEMLRPYVN